MENNIKSYFQTANSILIVLPKKPYFDQVAAGLSLYLSLLDKKQVAIVCPSPMLVEFNRLVGVNKVVQKPSEKNIIVHFTNYDASGIEKVVPEVKDGELYLTLIPHPGINPPKKDQVEIFYSGISCDLIILIGGADESHFPILSDSGVYPINKIHIGIRQIHQTKDNNIIPYVRNSSSVSELVADLIRELELEVDVDTASNLISGIEVGSNYYSSEGTTANTFQTIADLLRIGGRRMVPPPAFRMTTSPKRFEPTPVKDTEEKIHIQEPKPYQDASESVDQNNLASQDNPPSDWLAPKIFKGTSVS